MACGGRHKKRKRCGRGGVWHVAAATRGRDVATREGQYGRWDNISQRVDVACSICYKKGVLKFASCSMWHVADGGGW